MTYATCLFFAPASLSDATEAPAQRSTPIPKGGVGICRRGPPRLYAVSSTVALASRFPRVYRDHLCGEFDDGAPL